MIHFARKEQPENVVMDASVLINFLCIDRMDLIAGHSRDFAIADHVAAEISDQYSEQRTRLSAAIEAGTVSQKSTTTPEEKSLFGSLQAPGALGDGECSAIAMAAHRRYALAIDDKRAKKQAKDTDRELSIFTTKDPIVSMIEEQLLDVAEADQIKNNWATNHHFRLKFHSFGEFCT